MVLVLRMLSLELGDASRIIISCFFVALHSSNVVEDRQMM